MRQNLIKRLQNKVKSQSVNSLKNIYPDKIVEWLEIPEREVYDLIKYLHDQRVIVFKYRLKCSCGEICTVYENKLIHDKQINCEICGKEFTISDIEEKSDIIYEIDKEELLELENGNVDFKILPDIKGKVVSITKKQEERQEQKVMEIFMGSSSEAKDYMEEIGAKIEELEAKPLLWNATGKGIFIPGTNTIDSLIAISKRVQAAVFIFNVDDKIWNDKSALESSDTVRDNVLFEYGLFMGALSKENVCFVCKGKPKLASDLKGITYIDGDLGDIQVKLKLKDWINEMKK